MPLKVSLSDPYRSLIEMHVLFTATTSIILFFPILTIGLKLFLIVLSYNILLPVWALKAGQPEWLDIWLFCFPLSIFQVFPDWFLAAVLNTIEFEPDPYIMIGEVPAYMAGLWVIPLFVIIYLGLQTEKIHGRKPSLLVLSISSLVVFAIAEATLWMLPAWAAQNVFTIAHVAAYIVPAEVLLGISSFLGYKLVQGKRMVHKIVIGFAVMIFYLGNAAFFYFITERLIMSAL